MRIALAQINSTVGAVKENASKIIEYIGRARANGVDVVVFPELALSGYPPEDLLLKKGFLDENKRCLKEIVKASKSIFVVVGVPAYYGKETFNGAALIYNKKLLDIYQKINLPNYGVFDEKRYFQAGDDISLASLRGGARLSVSICEDIWHPEGPHRIAKLSGGANVLINISASPYHTGKISKRHQMLKKRAIRNKAFICYCNLTGGQDELVFDGGSSIYSPNGRLIARAGQFNEDMVIADLDIKSPNASIGRIERVMPVEEEIYSALTLGLRDYVQKNGFKKIVLGISGGIDSALTAAIACDALEKESVTALSMPSKYTSKATKAFTKSLTKNLGIKTINIPIQKICDAYSTAFKKDFKGTNAGITEENLQARIRGNTLMAFSNKFGWLVATTGNKSEISVGYCTLYGDTAGGFAVLKDVPKTLVYRLAHYLNKRRGYNIIPSTIIKRPPTAELRHKQKDQDTLPPYKILDRILDLYIEKDMSKEDILRRSFKRKMVERVISMVDKNEYKRRQSPPGVKIMPKAFGKDRRMPITNKFL